MNYNERLNNLIPGGAHTYSRGLDQFPENAPQILDRGNGAYVWDADGNKYLDYGMGLRAVTIGYGYKPIAEAAIEQIYKGNNLTRPSTIELKAAETITSLIPSAEMVKFAKNGSTVTSAAVKLARAYTGKKYIAICSDHPFFSYDDWFIGSTPVDCGIPNEIKSLTIKFKYNDIESLNRLFTEYKDQIAAVILEPVTLDAPVDNFLHKIKDLCKKNGAVFILDEMITGFRWDLQGAQKYFDITPDLSTFGKGMANGFSVAALVGKKEIMNLGGITDPNKDRVFLISTTHGAEMCGLGAFVKTVEVYKELDVIGHVWDYGQKLKDGMNNLAKKHGISDYFEVQGYPCSPNYMTKDRNNNSSLEFRTLFSQEMVNSNILMACIALCYQHGDKELEMTLKGVDKSLGVYAAALEDGVTKYLKGKVIKPVFRKKN
ncbi:MAG: glutamate-1-semialdehyde 2,1-aminomutase [Proteobacteria bacterium]|nr:glutamate-1-semialdehyde 2,1-aminomutase [Pseudomonadota bacterium]